MTRVFSETSKSRMIGVNPRLLMVVDLALQRCKYDFKVVEGVRSIEQCYINYGKGRTAAELKAKGVPENYARPKDGEVTWLIDPLNSKHRVQKDGTGHAIDLLPEPYDWKDLTHFDELGKTMLACAKELGVKIRWGADWDADGKPHERGETDSPHFELAE